jgi:transposase-like protein
MPTAKQPSTAPCAQFFCASPRFVGLAHHPASSHWGQRFTINARYRRAIRARGHFPTEQAALKCLYLVTRSLDPGGRGKARWAMWWEPALNAFAITFNDRIIPTGN